MAIRGIFSSPLSSATPSPMTDPAPLPESDIPLGFLSTRGWVLEELVQSSPNFCHVERISALDPSGIIGDKVLENETSGLPLIIQDWHRTKEWDSHMWSLDWLLEHFDAEKLITARNVRARVDYEMTLPDLVEKCCQTSMFASPNERERFYGKDLPCPPEWNQALDMLPSGLRPLGSNDLFANLDSKECPETLMIYLGIGDTFTPAHKDLCASYGQNLMTYTAPLRPHDPESPTDPSANPASAFWFLTSSADSIECSQYFNTLGAELDAETHIVTLDELRRAPFKVYICEQKLGDLVLVPPMSCHQVVNHGGITIKTSWSRMPLASLTPALHLELPIYRRVGREAIYRVKLIVYKSLVRETATLSESQSGGAPGATSLDKLRRLLALFDEILAEEGHPNEQSAAASSSLTEGEDLHLLCDCCFADIFQSFFECSRCVHQPGVYMADMDPEKKTGGEPCIICPACYVEGRSCKCRIMTPMRIRDWNTLLGARNEAARVLAVAQGDETVAPTLAPAIRIFEAACILWRKRLKYTSAPNVKKTIRPCNGCPKPACHTALFDGIILCNTCHRSTCVRHVLDGNIHVAEALLEENRDTQQRAWHGFHLEVRKRRVGLALSQDALKRDPGLRLALLAKGYKLHQLQDSRITLGFYDEISDEQMLAEGCFYKTENRHPNYLEDPWSSSEEDSSDTSDDSFVLRKRTSSMASTSRHPHNNLAAKKQRMSTRSKSNGTDTRATGAAVRPRRSKRVSMPSSRAASASTSNVPPSSSRAGRRSLGDVPTTRRGPGRPRKNPRPATPPLEPSAAITRTRRATQTQADSESQASQASQPTTLTPPLKSHPRSFFARSRTVTQVGSSSQETRVAEFEFEDCRFSEIPNGPDSSYYDANADGDPDLDLMDLERDPEYEDEFEGSERDAEGSTVHEESESDDELLLVSPHKNRDREFDDSDGSSAQVEAMVGIQRSVTL